MDSTVRGTSQVPGLLSKRISPEAVVAVAASILMGVKYQLPMNIPLTIVVGVVLLPVVIRSLSRYRTAVLLAVCVSGAALAGIVTTSIVTTPTSTSLTVAQTVRLMSLAVALAVLLWARSTVGLRTVVLSFGVGLLLSVPLNGVNHLNPWKFDYGLPLTLIVLSLPVVHRSRSAQLLAALALAAVNVAFDSRSAAGFLLIAAALTLTRERNPQRAAANRTRAIMLRLIQIVAVAGGAFLLLQAAILEGVLGDEIQSRTEAQVATSGSVLTGGRPEMGAAFALITANPTGYGSGALPTPSQILVAKQGMAALGYDPNNGYVENYMFGSSFEVHSGIGDLWLLFGPLGAIVAALCAFWMLRGLGYSLAEGSASTVAVYLVIRSLWDLGFSPLYTSITILPLALMVAAVPRPSRAGPASGSGEASRQAEHA